MGDQRAKANLRLHSAALQSVIGERKSAEEFADSVPGVPRADVRAALGRAYALRDRAVEWGDALLWPSSVAEESPITTTDLRDRFRAEFSADYPEFTEDDFSAALNYGMFISSR